MSSLLRTENRPLSYWNTIYLEDFQKDELFHLIDLAYETVLHSFSKKVQSEMLSGLSE